MRVRVLRTSCSRSFAASRSTFGASTPSPSTAATTWRRSVVGILPGSSTRPYFFAYASRTSSIDSADRSMRMRSFVNATQTSPTRSNESAIASLHASLHETGGTSASALTACTSCSTSSCDSSQLRQVRRCSSTAVLSIGASSRVRSASIRVNTFLHCIRHPLALQCIPEQLQRPEHFASQRGLRRPDGLRVFRVRHLFYESQHDQLARVDRQQGHGPPQQLDFFLPLQLRAFQADEWSKPSVVKRLQRLLERAPLRPPLVQREIAHGPEQPRPHRERRAPLLVVLPRQRPMRPHHRVLHHLLRIKRVLQNPMRIREQRPLEPFDEPLERPRLTPMDGRRQLAPLIRLPDDLAAGPRVLHMAKNTGRRGFVRGLQFFVLI